MRTKGDGYNAEGYPDPTPWSVEVCELDERRRKRRLIRQIKDAAAEAGFVLMGRIALKNKESGKVYR